MTAITSRTKIARALAEIAVEDIHKYRDWALEEVQIVESSVRANHHANWLTSRKKLIEGFERILFAKRPDVRVISIETVLLSSTQTYWFTFHEEDEILFLLSRRQS